MAEEKLYLAFKQDSKGFINEINELLIRIENDGRDSELINSLFRCIHSLKSEAAYLEYDDIAALAHEMESAIEPFRDDRGEDGEVGPMLESCFRTADQIEKMLEEVRNEDHANPEDEPESLEEEPEGNTEALFYSDFELILIKEARSRGERLYKLEFRIADDESMKYPRYYLAMSNLETAYNVIKAEPSPEQINETGDNNVTVILSTPEGEAAVADSVKIDQIADIRISELQYGPELRNRPVEEPERNKEPEDKTRRIISIEASEIDEINSYVNEIKKRLSEFSSALGKDSGNTDLELILPVSRISRPESKK